MRAIKERGYETPCCGEAVAKEDMPEIDVYRCQDCLTIYLELDEAKECCME